MTTIITRLYADQAAARAVVATLLDRGQDEDTIDIITRDSTGGAEAAMRAARVPVAAAAVYARAMSGREALLVVAAPFNPVGAARDAKRVVSKSPAIKVGLASEDHYVRESFSARHSGSVLTDHPMVMSNPHKPLGHGHMLGQNPILASKVKTSAIRGGAYMSKMFWPMKLVSTGRQARSAMSGRFLFSSLFGIPTLIGDLPSREMIKTKI
jgi:hypothetical protein